MEKLPDPFSMSEIMGKVEERTPYVVVAFQVIHNGWNDLYKRQFFGFGSALPILEIE